ncbi:MAG: aminoglycoside N(3)-acetyltransferase, partial [Candidatus Thorarchaeota archaeon]
MSHWEKEKAIVASTSAPITKTQLVTDFRKLGVYQGDTISVHSSMSKIGWVVGGQLTVIEALMEAVTEKGTLVMQAHSTGNTDPRNWNYPPVPEDWWDTIREEMPPFRPEITPLRNLGRIPELFRIMPGVLRSNHPQVSCTAWGFHAR